MKAFLIDHTNPDQVLRSRPSPTKSSVPPGEQIVCSEETTFTNLITCPKHDSDDDDDDNNDKPSSRIPQSEILSVQHDAELLTDGTFPLWFLFPTFLLHPKLQSAFNQFVIPLRRQLNRVLSLQRSLLDTACEQIQENYKTSDERFSDFLNENSESTTKRSIKPLILFRSQAGKTIETLRKEFSEFIPLNFLLADDISKNISCNYKPQEIQISDNPITQVQDISNDSLVSTAIEICKLTDRGLAAEEILLTVSEELQFSQRLTASLLESLLEGDCRLAECRSRVKQLDVELGTVRKKLADAESRYDELKVSSEQTLAAAYRRFEVKESRWKNTVAHLRENNRDNCIVNLDNEVPEE